MKRITAIRIEQLNDPNLPLGGPGRSLIGTSALTEFELDVAPASNRGQTKRVKFASASSNRETPVQPLDEMFDNKKDRKRTIGPAACAIDGKSETAWGVDIDPARRNDPLHAVFVLAEPVEMDEEIVLTFHLSQNHGGWNSNDNQSHNLGCFRFAVTDADEVTADPIPPHLASLVEIPAAYRSEEQLDALFAIWRTTVPQWQAANEEIAKLLRDYPDGSSQLVLQARAMPRETHLLKRGEFLNPGKEVEPGVPAFLNPLSEGAPLNRLTFARWLTDRSAPTTARAAVNRVWQTYFGIGLVSTSEDLGTQAEAPSHPELLDWLAVDFMDNGWSLKQLHRTILTSATYRQQSNLTPELRAADPYNRLLARGSRQRVEGELVRDIALAASGLLTPTVGGPSVYPPLPEYLLDRPFSYGFKPWPTDSGPDRYRRALYTFRYRSVPYPVLQTFDSPNGDASCVRRDRSNTPLQALMTLNEPLFVECAQALAQRILEQGGSTDDQRLNYAFRRCVARVPSEPELAELTRLLQAQRARIEAGEINPQPLVAIGEGENASTVIPADASYSAAELAAWTVVARVLLNLDETITRE